MDKAVTIYSTQNCHFCHQLKEFLTEKGIEYTDIDVGVDADARTKMVEMTGQMGVPVTVIGEDEAVIGFNKPKIMELLGISE